MTKPPRAPEKPHETERKQADRRARQQRLAEEMRRNLLKRKAQRRQKPAGPAAADEK